MSFSKRLKTERESLKRSSSGWTQEYVAEKIGVSRSTYTAYENGTKEPPLNTVSKIADLFNVSIDYLVRGCEFQSVSKGELAQNIEELELQFTGLKSQVDSGLQEIVRLRKLVKESDHKF